MPAWSASTSACTRSRRPSFISIRATCVLTVVSLHDQLGRDLRVREAAGDQVLVVVAVIAGVLASILPARRAAKLDPLTALAYQ